MPEGAVVVCVCGERGCIEASHLALSRSGRQGGAKDAAGRWICQSEETRK